MSVLYRFCICDNIAYVVMFHLVLFVSCKCVFLDVVVVIPICCKCIFENVSYVLDICCRNRSHTFILQH